jgi:SH3 domain protein
MVVILTVPFGFVLADTRYVSDRLIISVREGQGKNDIILAHIKTGTSVEVLEEEGRYLRITTENGLTGWVQAQYIMPDRPKALIIKDLRNQINGLNKKIERLEKNQDSSSEKFSTIKKSYEKKVRGLEQALKVNQEASAKAKNEQIQINKKYANLLGKSKKTDELIGEIEKLKKINTKLDTENKNLKKPSKDFLNPIYAKWFLAGAGALLFGFMTGRLARREKKMRFF